MKMSINISLALLVGFLACFVPLVLHLKVLLVFFHSLSTLGILMLSSLVLCFHVDISWCLLLLFCLVLLADRILSFLCGLRSFCIFYALQQPWHE